MHSVGIDLSRGLESIPVFLYEGDSSGGVPALDESYTYVRCPTIHSSVTAAAVPCAPLDKAVDSHPLYKCSVAMPLDCSCNLDEADRYYVGDGLLHPRYVIEVRIHWATL